MGDRAGCAFQHYSYDASTAPGTPLPQPEGEDESSHNDNVGSVASVTESATSHLCVSVCMTCVLQLKAAFPICLQFLELVALSPYLLESKPSCF